MRRLGTLIKLNIKRALQSLLSLVFGAIALIFLVGAIAFCGNEFLYGTTPSTEGVNPIHIAVVMDDDSLLAETISQGISSNEDVAEAIAFDFIDEESAMRGLEKGSYIAAILIAEDTVDSILNGTNTPIQIVFPENSGLEAILIKEIADAAATLLSSAQAGIYSVYDIYEEHDAHKHLDSALLRMNLKYISFVVGGSKLLDVTVVSATGTTPLLTYYICGGLVLFMMLLAINCFSFTDRIPAFAAKGLSLRGTPFILQELASYLGILVAELLTQLIVALPAIPILKLFGITLSGSSVGALLVILPIFSLLSSAFAYIISRLTDHSLGRIMIAFVSTVTMSFMSGCFIPSLLLPDEIQLISHLTPTYHMMNVAIASLSGGFDGIATLICIVFATTLVALGIIISYIRLRKELR